MKSDKKKKIELKGWNIGSTKEFLKLSDEEFEYIEMKLKLSKNFREIRKSNDLTQEQLARQLNSSQSRIAKMEAGDPSVSIDLLVRSLLALGSSKKQVAQMLN